MIAHVCVRKLPIAALYFELENELKFITSMPEWLCETSEFKLSSNFLTDRSKAVLLSWIFFLYLRLSSPYCHVCFLQPCDHLLGKG